MERSAIYAADPFCPRKGRQGQQSRFPDEMEAGGRIGITSRMRDEIRARDGHPAAFFEVQNIGGNQRSMSAGGGASSFSTVAISLSNFTGLVKYSLTPWLSAYILWRAPGLPVIMITNGLALRGFAAP